MEQRPYPFAYAQKEAFLALPPEQLPPHIWEALQYLEWRRTVGDVPQEEIDKQVAVMRHIAHDVAGYYAEKLEKEEAWRDPHDPRWPRFHADSKDPLYLTGCHPPLTACVPDDGWDEVDMDESHGEFVAWMHTPAGRHSCTDEMREQARATSEELKAMVEEDRRAETQLRLMRAELERKREELRQIDARIAAHPDHIKQKRRMN